MKPKNQEEQLRAAISKAHELSYQLRQVVNAAEKKIDSRIEMLFGNAKTIAQLKDQVFLFKEIEVFINDVRADLSDQLIELNDVLGESKS